MEKIHHFIYLNAEHYHTSEKSNVALLKAFCESFFTLVHKDQDGLSASFDVL